jgi:hypothetical protein
MTTFSANFTTPLTLAVKIAQVLYLGTGPVPRRGRSGRQDVGGTTAGTALLLRPPTSVQIDDAGPSGRGWAIFVRTHEDLCFRLDVTLGYAPGGTADRLRSTDSHAVSAGG